MVSKTNTAHSHGAPTPGGQGPESDGWGGEHTESEGWGCGIRCSRKPFEEVTLITDLGEMRKGANACWAKREAGLRE